MVGLVPGFQLDQLAGQSGTFPVFVATLVHRYKNTQRFRLISTVGFPPRDYPIIEFGRIWERSVDQEVILVQADSLLQSVFTSDTGLEIVMLMIERISDEVLKRSHVEENIVLWVKLNFSGRWK